MSVDVGRDAEQNSALLTFLAGTWATRSTVHVHSDGGTANGLCIHIRLEGPKLSSVFEPTSKGGVSGQYRIIQTPTANEEASTGCVFRLELDRSDNGLVARVGDDSTVRDLKGAWARSCVLFRDDFHDSFPMWEVFQVIQPQVTGRPSTVSIIVHQASESSWLLDIEFLVQQLHPSRPDFIELRCRLEFWHFRERPSSSPPPHPHDLEESFGALLQRCDDIAQDIEFRIDEIDDLIATFEESRSKCEQRLQQLKELKESTENGKDEADSLGGDLQEAILEFHEHPSIPAERSAVNGGPKEVLAHIWSELHALQADAESFDSEVDSIESDIDFPEDLIGLAWTNAEYARGQRLLLENRNHLPQPDLGFLGPLQSSVSKLSKASARIVKTTAVLFQAAFDGACLEELDYGPQIASMAKACERILDDVFKDKRTLIESDPICAALLSDERSWHYRIPASVTKVTSGDLTNVVKMIKRSIDTNTAIKWTGMGNKRFALLLFGGWIRVYQATQEHSLNPLEVTISDQYVQNLPDRLGEFQNLRNGFVHHDLADKDDLRRTWECFQDCLKGLLQAFYAGSA